MEKQNYTYTHKPVKDMTFKQMIAEAFCPEYITQIVSILEMVDTEGLKRSKIKWKSNITGSAYYNLPEVIYS